jgi:aryl-alcohol dehydrogenase-like predicted oxidoreductase
VAAKVRERRLGRSPLNVSIVGLGGNNFGRRLDLAGTRRVVDAALDAGINFIDTADVYGGGGESERLLGEIIAGRRDRVVLATKFGGNMGDAAAAPGPGGAPGYVRAAAEASLGRLGMERIDLLYYHTPDGVTPLADTLDAMHELVTEGKVVAIGCSNLDAAQLREAADHVQAAGITPVAALQNEYSLLDREAEKEILPLCVELDIGFVPYFPLGSGLLSGKYRRGQPPPSGTRISPGDPRLSDAALDTVETLAAVAEEHGHTLLELAIATLAWQPGAASVIAGAMTPEQVRANGAAAEWQPSPEVFAQVDAL